MANYDLQYEGPAIDSILDTGKKLEDDGYIFLGLAAANTTSGTPDKRVFYFAGPGSYSGFGVTIPTGAVGIFAYNGSAWVTSVINTGSIYDVSSANSGRTYASLSTAIEDIPSTARKAGMEIKFVNTSTSKYEVWIYQGTSTSAVDFTNTANWIGVDETPLSGSNNLVSSGGVYEAIQNAFDKLDMMDSTGTSVQSIQINVTLRRNDGTEEDPDWQTVASLVLPSATTTKAGLMSADDKAKITNTDGVFDISEYTASGGTPTQYESLSAALGTNGINVPQNIRKGGMSVKFVQSSDNKYVQWRLMATSFSVNVADWQKAADAAFDRRNAISDNEDFNKIVSNLYIGGVNVSDIKSINLYNNFNGNYGFYLKKTDNTEIYFTTNDSNVVHSRYFKLERNNVILAAEITWDNFTGKQGFTDINLSADVNDIKCFSIAYDKIVLPTELDNLSAELDNITYNRKRFIFNPTYDVTPATTYTLATALTAMQSAGVTPRVGSRLGFTNTSYKYEEWKCKQAGSYLESNWEQVCVIKSDVTALQETTQGLQETTQGLQNQLDNFVYDKISDNNTFNSIIKKFFISDINAADITKIIIYKLHPNDYTLGFNIYLGATVKGYYVSHATENDLKPYFQYKDLICEIDWSKISETRAEFDNITINPIANDARYFPVGLNIFYNMPSLCISDVSNSVYLNKYVKNLYIKDILYSDIKTVYIYKGHYDGSNYQYGFTFVKTDNTPVFYLKSNDASIVNNRFFSIGERFFAEVIWENIDGTRVQITDVSLNPNVNNYKYFPVAYNFLNSTESTDIVIGQTIHAVVGDRLQIFYKSIFNCKNLENYVVEVLCSKGKAMERCFDYTPVDGDVGTTTIIFNLRKPAALNDYAGQLIETKVCNLVVNASSKYSPSTSKQILCIGDSLITEGSFVAEAYRRLTANDGTPQGKGLTNITFIGSKIANKQGVTPHYEGTSGWSWNNYISPAQKTFKMYVSGVTTIDTASVYNCPSGNTNLRLVVQEVNITNGSGYIRCAYNYDSPSFSLNPDASGILTKRYGSGDSSIAYSSYDIDNYSPFYNNDTGQIDITSYVTRYGNGNLDYLVCELGVNSIAQMLDGKTLDTVKSEITTLIDALHSEYPNAKVLICTIAMPSQNGGFGNNYGAVVKTLYNYSRRAFELNQYYVELSNSANYSSFVGVINTCAEFDSDYLYPTTESYVNPRSTVKEVLGTNGVHPTTNGYLSIGDILFRELYGRL